MSGLMRAVVMGMLAVAEHNNPTVAFRRPGRTDWEPWHPTSQPRPPKESDAPFNQCHYQEPGLIEHPKGCVQWNSVHFVEVRFGNRTWTLEKGWQQI